MGSIGGFSGICTYIMAYTQFQNIHRGVSVHSQQSLYVFHFWGDYRPVCVMVTVLLFVITQKAMKVFKVNFLVKSYEVILKGAKDSSSYDYTYLRACTLHC